MRMMKMQIPDYNGNSIVNLMSSILTHFGFDSPYSNLELFQPNEIIDDETDPLDENNVERWYLITLYFTAPLLSIVGVSVVLIKKFKKQ